MSHHCALDRVCPIGIAGTLGDAGGGQLRLPVKRVPTVMSKNPIWTFSKRKFAGLISRRDGREDSLRQKFMPQVRVASAASGWWTCGNQTVLPMSNQHCTLPSPALRAESGH